jgi:hypothetical protein
MKHGPSEGDGRDLLELLLTAQGACTKWFGLINENGVLAAIDIILGET